MNQPNTPTPPEHEHDIFQALLCWNELIVRKHGNPDAVAAHVVDGFLWLYAISLDGGYLGFIAVPEPGRERADGIVTMIDGSLICHGIICDSALSKEELRKLAAVLKLPTDHFLDSTYRSPIGETPILNRIAAEMNAEIGDKSKFSQS